MHNTINQMREIAEMTAAAATAARNITQLSPPPVASASPCNPQLHNCRWWPYSNSSSFGVNTAMILIILLCALTCALALNTAIRCFLRGGGSRTPTRLPQFRQDIDQEQQKTNCEACAAPMMIAPTLVYTAGMKLGRAEADCAICLSEFVEGEKIRVLGKCKHGFHIHCIQQWLSSHSSCPVCRSSCLASSSNTAECCQEESSISDSSPQQVPAERAP